MSTLDELAARVRRLEDERAILRTLHQYGYSIDYGDEAMWVDVYTPDAVLHWPAPTYPAPFEGHDGVRRAFRGHTHAPRIFHKHLVVDPLIELDDGGDEARVVSYFARIDQDDDGPYLRGYGRYRDVLVRCDDGRWRIRERWADSEASSPRPRPGGPAGQAEQ
jgi:ketosteroid isomerase-like protein